MASTYGSFNLKKEKSFLIMNKMKLIAFCLSAIFTFQASAYVHNFTSNLKKVKWSVSGNKVNLVLKTTNTKGYSDNQVKSLVNDAVVQWNQVSTMQIGIYSSLDKLNGSISFVKDESFGSAVAGVTQVVYSDKTGLITAADILINDSMQFDTVHKESLLYLGNVLTHELGHLLGANHSVVNGATMFYALNSGQSILHADDKAGVYSLYPNTNLQKASLKGNIIGGTNAIAVFGVHVQAISEKTGQVAGASISEADGNFQIDGLDINDRYFIYTSPLPQLSIGAKYARAQTDFCYGSKSYRGSFYQTCHSSDDGFPQSFNLAQSNAVEDVGYITIKCALDNPSTYFDHKDPLNPFLLYGLEGKAKSTFVGHYSRNEMNDPSEMGNPNDLSHFIDHVGIDLSDSTFDKVYTELTNNEDLYVEVKVSNQAFYSSIIHEVTMTNITDFSSTHPEVSAFGKWNKDLILRGKIDKADRSKKIEIALAPFYSGFGEGAADSSLYPDFESYKEDLYFYIFNFTLLKSTDGVNFQRVWSKSDVNSDNLSCTDAPQTYALTTSFLYGASGDDSKKSEDKSATGCGSVNLNGNGPGPGSQWGSMILGMFFVLLISKNSLKKTRKTTW